MADGDNEEVNPHARCRTLARVYVLGVTPLLAGAGLDGAGSPEALPSAEQGLSPAQRAEVDRGRVVAEVLDSADRTEVVSIATLRVRTTAARLLACARDPGCFRASEDLLQSGVLRVGTEVEDLGDLSLDSRHLKAIRDCRRAACEVRLTGEAILRFRSEVDWKSPDHPAQVAALFRRVLAGQATAYRTHGNAGLPVYQDKAAPSSMAVSLNELLGRRFLPLEQVPDVRRGLVEYPAFIPPRAESVFVWARERFWRKVLVSLHHVTLADRSTEDEERVVITSKQLYATHFFESSLETTLFVRHPGEDDHGLLVFLSRSRTDIRPDGFTWLERLLLKRLVRGRLQGQLGRLRERLETPQ